MKTNLFLLAFTAATGSLVFAQAPLTPRDVVTKPHATTVDATKHDTERISVKFRDDLPVRLRQGKPADMSAKANLLNKAAGLLARLETAGAKWERLHTIPEEKLSEMREKAQRNTGKAMADLNTAYVLHVPKGMPAGQLIEELNALDIVELAEPMPLPAPPPAVGNFQPQQGYLKPAPSGIDAEYAWTQLAGAGGNVWITDIEFAWNLTHTDVPVTLVGPAPAAAGATAANISHGTAVLGEMGAVNNGAGTTGIVYNSTLFVATHSPDSGYNMASAITTAANAMREGDIILLEVQVIGPGSTLVDYVPVEWESQGTYDAIRTVVNNGIIVVEAAGNGSQNLDDPVFNNRHSPFRADHDSGAIIVGAGGEPLGSGDRSRMNFSCFGSRVNLQGWGEDVVTTGYGDLYSADGINSFYTATFNGTSSASPIVAGACASLQANYKLNNFGAVLTPFEMRQILQATGSPQTTGTELVAGFFAQSGMTVTRQSTGRNFSSFDINSVIRFATGEQATITAILSATQVSVDVAQNVAAVKITLNRFATQNIGPRPNLQAALTATGPSKWVDFGYGGTQSGTFLQPFNTFFGGYNGASPGGTVTFKGGHSSTTGTFTKQLTFKTYGSAVTFGP